MKVGFQSVLCYQIGIVNELGVLADHTKDDVFIRLICAFLFTFLTQDIVLKFTYFGYKSLGCLMTNLN